MALIDRTDTRWHALEVKRDAQVLKSFHATGFSQWLMTKFLSAEFIRRKFGGHGYCRAEIYGRAGARPFAHRSRCRGAIC
jgi:hypothetical protein